MFSPVGVYEKNYFRSTCSRHISHLPLRVQPTSSISTVSPCFPFTPSFFSRIVVEACLQSDEVAQLTQFPTPYLIRAVAHFKVPLSLSIVYSIVHFLIITATLAHVLVCSLKPSYVSHNLSPIPWASASDTGDK